MSPSPPPTDPLIGSTFSQYAIVAKLGGGGMGVVYKARDTKLGRSVALKFLPAQWSHDDAAKQRFMREAQAASATNHRNICVIHNIEETGDGRLFIVMAYYEGETLKHRLESGPLPIADAVDIAIEVAEGLAKAHAQGVIHRDIKPGNLIVTDDGVKILDFGLAKFADALQLTAPGSTIGTYAYMAPEQARGEEADERSDIWALGIVTFEMLTGAAPFRGAYPEATFHAIKHEPLPSLRTLRPDVPEALERLILKALDKDTSARYRSAREMARDLRVLAGRTGPLELRTEGVQVPAARSPVGRSVPRRRFATQGRLALAAVLVAALAGAAWYWRQRPVTRVAVAVVPVANHTGITALTQYQLALTEGLTDALSASPNIRVVPYLRLLETIRPFVLRGGDVSSSEAVQAIAAGSHAPFLVVPTLVYRDRDAAWSMQVQVRNAGTGTAVASYETAPVTSSLSQQTAFQLMLAAATQVEEHFRTSGRGRSFTAARLSFTSPDAARTFERGLNAFEGGEYLAAANAFLESSTRDDWHALTWAWLSRSRLLLGQRGDAVTAAERARTFADSRNRREAAFIDAVAAESAGNTDAAERSYRALLALDPESGGAALELADFLRRRQDRNSEAIEAYHAALTAGAGAIRPHVDLCQLYTRVDDHPLAEREARGAIEQYAAAGNPLGEAQALLCLAESQRSQGGEHLIEARQSGSRAVQLLARLDVPFNRARATFYDASILYSSGEVRQAEQRFSEALSELQAAGNRSLEATTLMNLGVANTYLGRPSRGVDYFRQGRDAFVALGLERRAAEMEVNAATLRLEFGVGSEDAARDLANAKRNLERLGHVDFQIGAMQSEADASRYAGRLSQAERTLRVALEVAKDKQLTRRIAGLNAALANVLLDGGAAGAAVQLLQPLVTESGRQGDEEARLALGVAMRRLGQFAAARRELERVASDVQRRDLAGLLPASHLALAMLAEDDGRPADARASFEKARRSWNDSLPNPFSIESRCVEALSENRPLTDEALLTAAIASAQQLGRLALESTCRVALSSAQLRRRDPAAAAATLASIPEDDATRTIDPELRATVEYWRGQVLQVKNAAAAAAHFEKSRSIVRALQAQLPPEARSPFTQRRTIRRLGID